MDSFNCPSSARQDGGAGSPLGISLAYGTHERSRDHRVRQGTLFSTTHLDGDGLTEYPIFPLTGDELHSVRSSHAKNNLSQDIGRKRSHEDASTWSVHDQVTVPTWYASIFPELMPSVPAIEQRLVSHGLPNPFQHAGTLIHPRLRVEPKKVSNSFPGAINGLVKFRLQVKHTKANSWQSRTNWPQKENIADQEEYDPFRNPAPYLPSNFALGVSLDGTDQKLLKFYQIAWCTGRTLLPGSNCFLNEVTAMACGNACVRHALLALASTYVLDYLPSESLSKRANLHYRRSVLLLGQEMNQRSTYLPGKEDVVLTTLVLLCVNDLVNWEGNEAVATVPEWLIGNRTAKTVLDCSDPGYKYEHPENVQYGNIRRYMGGKAALVDIFCSTMATLEKVGAKCPYSWLLEGTEREIRKVDGLNGLSPKLLHTYAQITHLAARLEMDPASIVIPRAATVLEVRLQNFWQWSEVSEGYDTPDDLLSSCIVDMSGKVFDPVKVTELTAECYVASAELYLQCRLLRKPRTHPSVQKIARRLLRCIELQPTEGNTFTAMAPMYSIFVAGLVVFRSEDREIIRNWFLRVIKGTRGNVPPAWRALKRVWEWQDDVLSVEEVEDEKVMPQDILEDDGMLAFRRAWWEEMVLKIESIVGKMNLA